MKNDRIYRKIKGLFPTEPNDRSSIIAQAQIKEELLKKRRLKKGEIIHKALLRNKLKTPQEKEQELEDENLKEYFYVKKREFFEDTMTDKFLD